MTDLYRSFTWNRCTVRVFASWMFFYDCSCPLCYFMACLAPFFKHAVVGISHGEPLPASAEPLGNNCWRKRAKVVAISLAGSFSWIKAESCLSQDLGGECFIQEQSSKDVPAHPIRSPGGAPARTSPLPREFSYSCKHVLLPAGPAHGKNSSVDRNLSTRGDKEPSHTWRCVCKPSGPGTRHRQSSGTSMKHHTLIISTGERGAFIQSFAQTTNFFCLDF